MFDRTMLPTYLRPTDLVACKPSLVSSTEEQMRKPEILEMTPYRHPVCLLNGKWLIPMFVAPMHDLHSEKERKQKQHSGQQTDGEAVVNIEPS